MTPAHALALPLPVAAEPEPDPARRILIVSRNNGLCQMVKVALAAEPGTAVQIRAQAMADLLAEPAALAGQDIVVFEARPSDAAEMQALARLTAASPPGTRFLAITHETLSLTSARLLMEAGVEEVLPLSAIRPDLHHAVDLQAEVTAPERGAEPRAVSGRKGLVIAVARARGGIGATTVAVNLATLLAEPKGRGGKVVLLDLDLQNGNAGFFLDIADQGALIGMIRNATVPDSTFLRTAVTEHRSGLHVLPAPAEFAPLTALTSGMVAALIEALQCDYDHVVVDLPAAVVDWIEPVLSRAARVLLVTDTSVPALRQARRLIDLFTEDNVGLPVEIVVNREKRPMLLSAAHKEAARLLDRPLTHWLPSDEAAARAAVDRGAALAQCAPRSALTKGLRKLAEGLIAEASAPHTAARKTA